MTRIVIPPGLSASDKPCEPEVRRLYWLRTPLLDADDPEPDRPAVVLVVSQKPAGEILVGLRSSTERNGTRHDPQPEHGLTRVGWFSRGRAVNPELWTPNNAPSIDLLLDETTFSHVWRDLVPEGFA